MKLERCVKIGSLLNIPYHGTQTSRQVQGILYHLLFNVETTLIDFSRFYALAAIYNQSIIGLIVAEIKPYAMLNPEDTGILAKSFIKTSDVGYILSLGVSKQYRRNGIASLLLDSLIRHLTTTERKRVKAVFLHVLTSNTPAILFYEHRK